MRRRARPTCSPCSGRGSGAARPPRAARPRDRAVALDQQVAQLVVPRARERDRPRASSSRSASSGSSPAAWTRKCTRDALALVEHVVGLDAGGAEAAAEQPAHALDQRGVVARAREREDQRRAAPVGVAAAEQPDLGRCPRAPAATASAPRRSSTGAANSSSFGNESNSATAAL